MKTAIKFIAAAAIVIAPFAARPTESQVAGNPPYTLEQTVMTSGGGTSADGAGNIYKIEGAIGQPVAGTTSTNVPFTLRGGFFTPAPFAPTAALAKISGRILTADGRGIRNVSITMTNAAGELRMAFSSSFGHFTFENVPAGEVYILTVRAKQFQFSQNTQAVSLLEDLADVNFIADPQ
ncbi:MAG TPA: carboxypeptidase-like regulatory domain-containing protein [Pyrinomonadaceae bacterium]|nr:carboxypeptidase-like regulatory domain-containing protein [Pyrinomonadaceae bacterium]